MIFLALLVTGLAAGALGALLGLGGGIFLVPALTLVFHMPIHIAVATSLAGVIATSAGVASASTPGRGADERLALRLEVVTAAGAIVGGWLAGYISHEALSILFSFVVFLTAFYTFYKAHRSPSGTMERLFARDYQPRHWAPALAISNLAGMVSGLLGVGGGFIKVPVLYAVMEVPLGIATATSNFMVGITAAASIFVYYGRGDIRPLVVLPTVLGVFLGAMAGVKVLTRLRVGWLRIALIGLLFLIGVQMLLHGVGK